MRTDDAPILDLFLATDSRALVGCAVAGRSLIDRIAPGSRLRITVAHSGLGDPERSRLAASWASLSPLVDVSFVPFPRDRVRGLLRSRAIPEIAYARLLVGDLIPDDAVRCLYLDTDVVACTDPGPLLRHPLDGAVLGAVANGTPEDDAIQRRRLGLSGGRYFNSGVLLIDVERWRAAAIGELGLRVARSFGDRLLMHDQDALNVVLADRWQPLEERWNRWARRTDEAEGNLVHYTTAPKPWDADYNGPHRDAFFRVLDATAWSGYRPGGWMGRWWARTRRSVPYGPTVVREVRRWVSGAIGG